MTRTLNDWSLNVSLKFLRTVFGVCLYIDVRDLFRTQSNIYDEAFFQK